MNHRILLIGILVMTSLLSGCAILTQPMGGGADDPLNGLPPVGPNGMLPSDPQAYVNPYGGFLK